jgi:hypothetical protein
MTQPQYTLSWMLSLVRASFQAQRGDLIYRHFVRDMAGEGEMSPPARSAATTARRSQEPGYPYAAMH